ncbi:hypothetical protein Lal_00039368 [Lupinus albus]|nr:hypothetical protein Lal_00039368 [Lupinus albus]
MFELIAKHDPGFKPPSYHEIRVKYLKEDVKLTNARLEEHKAEWKKVECTITTDVGGIVTQCSASNNASNYKAAGEILMEKRKKLYWTHSCRHNFGLMLEEFEKKILIHAETIYKGRKYARNSLISLLQQHTKGRYLVRSGLTQFATSYLTVSCLNDNRISLIRIFTSAEWTTTKFTRTHDWRLIEDVVLDKEFWKIIVFVLKCAFPLVKVLRVIDSDDYEKALMRLIYEAMDQVKEKIKSAYNGLKDIYMPLWKIIDDKWCRQLHRPLLVAGHFLNPQLHYAPRFTVDLEVRNGLFDFIGRMLLALETVNQKTPTDWWDFFGDETLEIKSLMCSSSGCERNRSGFEMVHTKKRNKLMQEQMNDVIFVMKQARKGVKLIIDDIPSDDEWIVEHNNEDENHLVDPKGDGDDLLRVILGQDIGEDIDNVEENEDEAHIEDD